MPTYSLRSNRHSRRSCRRSNTDPPSAENHYSCCYFINSPTETPIAFANFVIVASAGLRFPFSKSLTKLLTTLRAVTISSAPCSVKNRASSTPRPKSHQSHSFCSKVVSVCTSHMAYYAASTSFSKVCPEKPTGHRRDSGLQDSQEKKLSFDQ